MNDDIKEIALSVRHELIEAPKYLEANDFDGMFMSAETIIGSLAALISPIMLLEQRYRVLIVGFMNDGDSHAKAEAKAKASDEYVEWKKYNLLYELAHEQVMLLKKFKDKLEGEYKRIN